MKNAQSNPNVCAICKKKELPVDLFNIKSYKVKKLLATNRINKEDLSTLIKKCNCKIQVHRFCILLNVIFNYEIKCQECNNFYNVKVSREVSSSRRCKELCYYIFLFIIHLILYAGSVILYIFNFTKDKIPDKENKFICTIYFFAAVVILINTCLLYITVCSFSRHAEKDIYLYFININEKDGSNNNKDRTYFEPLYDFYKYFYNNQIKYLINQKQESLYGNKRFINKKFVEFFEKNNSEFLLNNGNSEVANGNGDNKDNKENTDNNAKEDILAIKENKVKDEKEKVNNNNMLVDKSKTTYLYKKWNPIEQSNGINQGGGAQLLKKTSTLNEYKKITSKNITQYQEKIEESKNENEENKNNEVILEKNDENSELIKKNKSEELIDDDKINENKNEKKSEVKSEKKEIIDKESHGKASSSALLKEEEQKNDVKEENNLPGTFATKKIEVEESPINLKISICVPIHNNGK